MPGRGLEHADHEPNDVARRVEVAALLARRLGKHVDQELVGRAEQVGELEVLVAQTVAAEVADEVLAGIIRNDALVALHPHELMWSRTCSSDSLCSLSAPSALSSTLP